MDDASPVPVRVAVRVRPLLPAPPSAGSFMTKRRRPASQPRSPLKTTPTAPPTCVQVFPATNQILLGKDRRFAFDHALDAATTQRRLFVDCVAPMIEGFFEGFNATIFAYGQTSSGKTYTMGGHELVGRLEDEMGVIPRAIDAIFDRLGAEDVASSHHRVFVSFVEVYLENLRDLLDMELGKEIHVREDDRGNTVVCGAVERECYVRDDVVGCLTAGAAIRHTSSTNMNELSSRSHTVFTLTLERLVIEGRDGASSTGKWLTSKFHFVDLAGSERVNKTGNVGDRFKESVQINAGLLALGNVISALSGPQPSTTGSSKTPHIPYRDSKITRILKDSLGGNSLTLMICCVSPSTNDFDETLNSLRFAERAKKIHNNPRINASDVENLQHRLEIESLTREVKELQGQLQERHHVDEDVEQTKTLRAKLHRNEALLRRAWRQISDVKIGGALTQSQDQRIDEWLAEFRAENVESEVDTSRSTELQRRVEQLLEELEDSERRNEELARRLEERTPRASIQTIRRDDDEDEISRRGSTPAIYVTGGSDDVDVERKSSSQSKDNGSIPICHKCRDSPMNKIQEAFRRRRLEFLERVNAGLEMKIPKFPEEEEDFEERLERDFPSDSTLDWGAESGLVASRVKYENTWTLNAPADSLETIRPRPMTTGEAEKRSRIDGEDNEEEETSCDAELIDQVRSSTTLAKRRVRASKLNVVGHEEKLKDLSLTIKLKEGLIRELVKNGKEAKAANEGFQTRVKKLESEKNKAQADLEAVTRAFKQLEAEGGRADGEVRRRMADAERRAAEAETRLKATQTIVKQGDTADKRAVELQAGIKKLKTQQENTTKKLREEQEKKSKLERDLQREKQRLRSLESRFEQQQKVLKRKSEEAMRRRKKSAKDVGQSGGEADDGGFLEEEMEKVMARQEEMDKLKAELESRDEMLRERERLVMEKERLEGTKTREIRSAESRVGARKSRLAIKELEMTMPAPLKAPVSAPPPAADNRPDASAIAIEEKLELERERENLLAERRKLDERVMEGSMLGPGEEQRLLVLEEALEAVDAAIEHKTSRIEALKREVRAADVVVRQSQAVLLGKFRELTRGGIERQGEAAGGGDFSGGSGAALMGRFFDKIVALRQDQKELRLRSEELETLVDEKDRLIDELKMALEKTALEAEARTTRLERRHLASVRAMMTQMRGENMEEEDGEEEGKEIEIRGGRKKGKGNEVEEEKESQNGLAVSTPKTEGRNKEAQDTTPRQIRTRMSPNRSAAAVETTPREDPALYSWTPPAGPAKSGTPPSGMAPIRVSRKVVRAMSEEEILRRSESAKEKRGAGGGREEKGGGGSGGGSDDGRKNGGRSGERRGSGEVDGRRNGEEKGRMIRTETNPWAPVKK